MGPGDFRTARKKRYRTNSETTFNDTKPKVLETVERAKLPKTELAAQIERMSDTNKESTLGRRNTSLIYWKRRAIAKSVY